MATAADLMGQISEAFGDDDEDLQRLRAFHRDQQQAEDEAHRAEAAIVKRALDSEAGRVFMEWLEGKTIKRRPSPEQAAAQTAEGYALIAARREGQNAIFHVIQDALDYVGGPPKAETDT